MERLSDPVFLSRLQFSLTAMFHILWPVVTVGLSWFLVLMEALWLRTRDPDYYRHARFWGRLFLLNVAVGVASGIPMEFQFGTNWSPLSIAGGDFLGHMLGYEAAVAFMLEATFLGVMALGWEPVPPGMHLFSTLMVAFGASLSAFWIMVTNSWIHTPTGAHLEAGRFVITSHLESIFNPDMPWGVTHMWFACLEITAFVVGGLSAWHIRRGQHTGFFLKSFKLAFLVALVAAPLQVWLGDGSGRAVYEHQPTKLAGIEAHWKTNPPGEGAAWSILAWPDEERQENRWAIEIPYGLSLITSHSWTGRVPGLREFPKEDQPPIWLPYYAFRVMIAGGFGLAILALWTLWAWWNRRLTAAALPGQRKLLAAWVVAIPVSYLAMEAGWVTREVGRQPWAVYGVLRTADSATVLPAPAVATTLCGFAIVYATVLVLFWIFARRLLSRGPGPGPRVGAVPRHR